jgi:hypothetical protein
VRSFAVLDAELESIDSGDDPAGGARALLAIAEETREGFRLLALHRQGARGVPSFNACRETCREIAYHYNLLTMAPQHEDAARRRRMMTLLVRHLLLFVSGKMQVNGLGEFCCASRPLRTEPSTQGGHGTWR